jgi:tetratricopeptide (TPR) repeat protein
VRRSALITIAALLVLAVGLAQRNHHKREFSTTSAEAYKLYVEGDEALNSFQYRKAEDALQRALELDPSFAMAQAALAELYEIERPDIASEANARADSLAQLLTDENERLLVQLRVARHGEAATRRDSLLTLLDQRLPRHPIVLTTHAIIATNAQEGERAEKLWREILEENPNYARAYNWLGYNAAYMGRFDEALQYLKKYAYLAPNLANPHDSLGEVLSMVGRYEDAEREFRAALEIQPDFSHSIIYLALTHLMRGRVAKGVDIMEKLRGEVAGTGFEYLIDELLIRFYYEHQLEDRLHEALLAYEKRYPEGRNTRYFQACRLLMDGKLKEAEALNDSLIAAWREQYAEYDTPAIRESLTRMEESFRGRLATIRGDDNAAVEHWQTVADSQETVRVCDRFSGLFYYGTALCAVGRYEEGLAQARWILTLNPRYLPALILQGRALVALERWQEARVATEALAAALAQADPDFPYVTESDRLARLVRQRTSS